MAGDGEENGNGGGSQTEPAGRRTCLMITTKQRPDNGQQQLGDGQSDGEATERAGQRHWTNRRVNSGRIDGRNRDRPDRANKDDDAGQWPHRDGCRGRDRRRLAPRDGYYGASEGEEAKTGIERGEIVQKEEKRMKEKKGWSSTNREEEKEREEKWKKSWKTWRDGEERQKKKKKERKRRERRKSKKRKAYRDRREHERDRDTRARRRNKEKNLE